MKILFTVSILVLLVLTNENDDSIYDFKLKSIDGDEIEMSEYSGNVLLIVNTASECGFTPQYDGLQNVYDKYKEDDFYVLGFPANNFGGQEPGTDEEIAEFCSVNFNINFPMFSKVSVKGDDIHPLFEYLTTTENRDFSGEIGWNFEKFLVDKEGTLVRRFKSKVEPDSKELTEAIETALVK
ncbi:MAG: glutathione peroxidase [Balneolaceae bacterium]